MDINQTINGIKELKDNIKEKLSKYGGENYNRVLISSVVVREKIKNQWENFLTKIIFLNSSKNSEDSDFDYEKIGFFHKIISLENFFGFEQLKQFTATDVGGFHHQKICLYKFKQSNNIFN